jgi:hypothetical protein
MKNLRKQGGRKSRKKRRFISNLSLNRGVWRERETQKGEGEGKGKEGSKSGPKKTTETGGKASCRGQENCTTIPDDPIYSLRESHTQKGAYGGMHW